MPPTNDPSMSYIRRTNEGPDDMPANIKSSLLPTHLLISISKEQSLLGRWQSHISFSASGRKPNKPFDWAFIDMIRCSFD